MHFDTVWLFSEESDCASRRHLGRSGKNEVAIHLTLHQRSELRYLRIQCYIYLPVSSPSNPEDRVILSKNDRQQPQLCQRNRISHLQASGLRDLQLCRFL